MFWTILKLIITNPSLLAVVVEIIKRIGVKAAADLFVRNLTAVEEEVGKDTTPPKNDEESKRLLQRIFARIARSTG